MKWLIAILILATFLIAGCTQSISNVSLDNSNCPVKDTLKNCISDAMKTTGHFASSGICGYCFTYDFLEVIKSCNKTMPQNYQTTTETGVIPVVGEAYCNNGSKSGENINYIYCNLIPLSFNKIVINPEGVIQEKTYYNVKSLVLNSSYDVIDIKCYKGTIP